MSNVEEMALQVRRMRAEDAPAILAFARGLPVVDLLFLRRDIRQDKVVAAWVEQEEQGMFQTLVAVAGDAICGCAALVRDPLGWSPHVGEIRVIVAADARGSGLGRRLAQSAFSMAVTEGVEKLFVRLVPHHTAAIALFEEMGFRAEAMLRDHVRDADGTKHDIAMLSLDVHRQGGQHRAYGWG